MLRLGHVERIVLGQLPCFNFLKSQQQFALISSFRHARNVGLIVYFGALVEPSYANPPVKLSANTDFEDNKTDETERRVEEINGSDRF